MTYTYPDIAKMIDHSLLNPAMTDKELVNGCTLALEYDVATVCIKPYFINQAAELLSNSTVKPTTTIGFPHGGHSTAIKVFEAERALNNGALELDVVINIGKSLSGDWEFVRHDIKEVTQICHHHNALIKVIFENCYLKDEHKIKLCELCGELEVDFVKTSTGYGSGGATIEDLKLMRKYSPPNVQVKAAGGIRTLDQLLEVRALGVTRVGATRTKEILDECKQRLISL